MTLKGYRQPKAFIGEGLSNGWAARLLQLSRQSAKILVGLITGHAKLNPHKYKTGKAVRPDCRNCAPEDETTRLILCDGEVLVN